MRIINFSLLVGLLLGSSTLFAGPKIENWQLSSGARVYYVYAPEIPMVDIRVVFDAGSARDGKRPGLAALTSSLLDEGTPSLNADQIAEKFADVGAGYGASSLRDMAVVSLRSLTDKSALTPALAMFTDVLAKPTFPKKSFERNRQSMLVGLDLEKQSPAKIASRTFFSELYGVHPYASHGAGSEKSLNAMSRKHVIDYHKQYYVANNAVIAIVGAVKRKQAESIARQITSGMPAGKRAAAISKVPTLDKANKQRIAHDSTQTHIYVGQPGIRRGDPDYFTLYVGNHILGGSGLVSRLSDLIREQRGLAYSVYSYFSPMRENGPFIMGMQTKNDQADEALALLNQALRNYIEKGPSADELQRSKQNITGGFALRVDSNRKITEYVAMIGFYGLPLDYLDNFNARVEAVTVKAIKSAFKRRIDPDKLVTILVGGK